MPTSCAVWSPTHPISCVRGGAVLLELGGDQAEVLRPTLESHGYASVRTWSDEDGDLRGLEATYG